MSKIRVSIIGVNGYTGYELIRILLHHPDAELRHLAVRQEPLPRIDEIFPALRGMLEMVCSPLDPETIAPETDILFSALPHTVSMDILPEFMDRNPDLRVIDLSADYRLDSAELYRSAYKTVHRDSGRLGKFIYGLPEFNRDKIRGAQFVANPGCFPTGIQLSLMPVLKAGLIETRGIFVDSKTGVSGGGRQPKPGFHFPQINENMHAYKPGEHQHEPEIEQQLSKMAGSPVDIVFVPHLIPVTRGIINTVYATLKNDTDADEIRALYGRVFSDEPFVRFLNAGETPQILHVNNTNFCDVAVAVKDRTLILMSAIDNLVKGASGQAVQNMNCMLGLDERTGLL